MSLTPFTRNYEDNSTDAGFQFTFYCDLCNNGYKSEFQESDTYKRGNLMRNIAKGISIGASIFGKYGFGSNIERGADIFSERFQGMSPEWHKEHEAAFERAQREAKDHFTRCPKCRLWVCEDDWNEQEGLCVECAPRMNVEIAAKRAEKMVEDIEEKTKNTTVFDGKIESKHTVCPQCGKQVGSGKFCNNCGANLSLNNCPECGKTNSASSRFCSECGCKLK